ncbi:C40 family peptidase [Nonlabens sp. SCSIO 43208]|uniref:C40 family peptidase n=1 Tax=Nonlabens sp. SCSIO 43208 TaxID=2793009 RepID=UPI003D6B8BCE
MNLFNKTNSAVMMQFIKDVMCFLSERLCIFTLSRKRKQYLQISKHVLIILFTTSLISGCGSSKPKIVTTKKEARKLKKNQPKAPVFSTVSDKEDTEEVEPIEEELTVTNEVDRIIAHARGYLGTRYRYGGNDKNGVDCSGLICNAYGSENIQLPRTSAALYQSADRIKVKEVQKGDLLFFATGRNKKKVNHVGLVTDVTPAGIEFIHSTTSRGVIITSFNEAYWFTRFLKAGRIK